MAAERLAGELVATDIWNLLGKRLDEIGQTDRAAEAWQRARESGRRTGNHYKYLHATLSYAKSLLDEGQDDQAHHLLEEVVEQGISVAPQLAAGAIKLLDWEKESAYGLSRRRISRSSRPRRWDW